MPFDCLAENLQHAYVYLYTYSYTNSIAYQDKPINHTELAATIVTVKPLNKGYFENHLFLA